MLPAESKFLSLQGTDNIYHEKQQSMRKQPSLMKAPYVLKQVSEKNI
ncbi:hypothetical protein M4D55_00570 [Metabacillus idriensis]|uniref:Uncharacterized protein n=1 Tax=Metabacillus idriensis TaxID=324768 RepID=A0A6I2M8J2_9BACI|nr:hypothetical protein [Metabacillus idriensis]MCM3594275.1 hypothetical protein [Metabacillus idriensis]MRX53694.1 hypothetical protein [Metabacillus idriensis]